MRLSAVMKIRSGVHLNCMNGYHFIFLGAISSKIRTKKLKKMIFFSESGRKVEFYLFLLLF